jgi:chemotaxis family two-component system response regulator Rcp1
MMESIGTDAEAIEVLLVEDSPGDVRLTREAFRDAKVHINLHVAADGVEAMAFLNRQGLHATALRPDLILLDLNLPKKDGREVLKEIKESSTLKCIPVVILTTSASEADIMRSYEFHANCYISKPVDLEGFLKVVRSIDNFWLSVVRLPRKKTSMA